MMNFVAENTAHYEWDVYVLLKMHGTNLARWVARMMDCLNMGDELAIYTMCDMHLCLPVLRPGPLLIAQLPPSPCLSIVYCPQ